MNLDGESDEEKYQGTRKRQGEDLNSEEKHQKKKIRVKRRKL